MKQHIEKMKNWVKEHKKAVILTTSGVAAGVAAIVFRNNYHVLSKHHDWIAISKDAEPIAIPEAVKSIGKPGMAWENSEHIVFDIGEVPLSKLGEAGEVFAKGFKDEDVYVLVTYDK